MGLTISKDPKTLLFLGFLFGSASALIEFNPFTSIAIGASFAIILYVLVNSEPPPPELGPHQ